ncbi:MAG: hypothetical protein J5I81_03825 [Nitrococcus mobilis]|nr:hypothetical protein [Nitrococcus mobilis]
MRNEQAKAIERLLGELAERNQVIGELTVANRILKNPRRPAACPEKEKLGPALD